MRKLKLLLVTLALLVGGALSSWADTTLLTAGDGWQKITEMPTDVSLYYFTIVDNNQDLMLTLSRGLNSHQGTDYNGLFYGTSANPLIDKSKLFSLEKDGENYVLRNVEYNGYFLQTENNAAWNYRTHDNGGGGKSWGHIKFTYGEGVWTIQNAKYAVDNGNYMGMWDNAAPANGKDIALNKGADAKGTFQIYAILKTTVDAYYAALTAGKTLGATPSAPVDMTGLIVNPNARFWKDSNPFGWTTKGTQNINNGAGYDGFPGVFEFSDWNAGNWTGSLKQTITVPNGKYKLKAAFMAAEGVTAYLTANGDKSDNLEPIGDTGGNINADGTETTMGSGQRGFKYLTVETTVTTGSLEIGTYGEASAEHLWVNADNFTLSYLDPFISVVATDIPAATATALSANAWYKFTAASTDNFSFATTTIDDIIYTTTDQLQSTATGSNATATMALTSETTYYIKSTSAQTLTITPQTFTYTVGDGTPSVADDKYTQTNTFTLTFADYATDDPDASFQILDASKIKVNSAAATASLTDNVLTITLADALTASTDYAISVAAGAVGYKAEADKSNAAIALTVHTPAVFDGHYYIKKNGADLYFSRGGDENKQTVLDAYGIPVKITTDESNMSRVKFIDTDLLLGASNSSNMYWTDKSDGTPSTVNWTIAKSGDKYKFYLMSMDDAKKGMNIHTNGTEPKSDTEANACDWELELPAVHKAKLQAIKDTQAADVATSVGITGVSTQAEMATKLAADFGTTNITITGTGGTNREAWQKSAHRTTNDEYAVFNEETVSDLKPGLYRLRVHGFERITNGQAVYDAGGAAGLAYVYATSNGATEKVKLASLFDVQSDTQWKTGNDLQFGGKYYPNGQEGAQAAFNAEKYANDVYVKVVDEGSGTGSIKFGIKQPNCYYQGSAENPLARAQWICYNNFSLTLFEAKATADEKTALANAITAAGAKTLGFETGEYAPYANAAALEALAAAKAIDPENASGTSVVAATTALTSATWTANASEKNAIAYGDLSSYETVGGKDYPYGWSKYDDGSRIMGGSEGTTNAGLSASSTGKAMLVKYNAKYGEQVGYTMPLKAGQLYKISFNYCGWGNNPTTNVVIKRPNGTSVTVENTSFKPATNDGNLNAAHWYEYTGSFTADVAGDYVLELNKVESGQQQIAWADMQLVKTQEVSANMTITSAKYATFIAPFDVAIPSGVTASKVLAAEDKTLTLTPVETTIPANTPVVLYKDVTGADFTQDFNGADRSTKNTYTVGLLTGVYADTPATPGTYVLQNQSGTVAFYKVTSGDEPTVGKNRAYVNAGAFGAGIKAFFFDEDETTAIEGLDVLTSGEYDAIYNAAGIQVEALQKGLNIVVKDGKSYKIYVK